MNTNREEPGDDDKLLFRAEVFQIVGCAIEVLVHRFETRSLPNSLAAARRGFTFYLADPSARLRSCNGCGATARGRT